MSLLYIYIYIIYIYNIFAFVYTIISFRAASVLAPHNILIETLLYDQCCAFLDDYHFQDGMVRLMGNHLIIPGGTRQIDATGK